MRRGRPVVSTAFGACSAGDWITGNCSTVDALSFAKLRHQHVAAVGKFDRVMMTVADMRIDRLNLPTAKPMVLVQIQRLSYLTFSANASSVPGSMQTATFGLAF